MSRAPIDSTADDLPRSAARAVVAGAISGLLSLAVLAWRSRVETGTCAAALNAPSHWIYGDRALRANRASLRHTLTGVLIHQASAVFWGGFYEALLRRLHRGCRPGTAAIVAGAAGVTATAAMVDLKLVPKRLTPGFERRVSTRSLVWTYGAFAAGLALAGLVLSRAGAPAGPGKPGR